MKHRVFGTLAACLLAAAIAAAPQAGTGTIKGHVRLAGKLPGNPIIRMGRDPKCAQMNRNKRPVQEYVMADIKGNLANVFAQLQGTFPKTPVPSQPVVIEQEECMYRPRVVGVRAGQTLELKNDDDLLHNLHSSSKANPVFNVGQPIAGLVYKYVPKKAETMIHLGCDVHSWMNAYVGVVDHPYFAVSDAAGTFTIGKVPAGTHTIQIWHEIYGMQTRTVTVKAGATATVEFTYMGK